MPPVAGYSAWYDASDSGSITESGGLVSQWSDKSGNNWHVTQTTDANKPSYQSAVVNGLNVVRFNGTASYLRRNTGFPVRGYGSVFAVLANRATTGTFQDIVTSCDEGSGTRYSGFMAPLTQANADMCFFQRNNDTQDTVNTPVNSVPFGAGPIAIEAHSNDTAYDLRINGVSQSLAVAGGANNGDWWGDTTGRDNMVVGAIKTSGAYGQFLKADLCELLMYDGVTKLTDNEKDQIWGYLRGKWFGSIKRLAGTDQPGLKKIAGVDNYAVGKVAGVGN